MIRDFHHAVAIEWKTLIAGSRNSCAENWKTFRGEKFALFGFQMKYRLPAGAKKIASEWQGVRGTHPNGHHNRDSFDLFSVLQQYPFYAIASCMHFREDCICAK